MRQVNRSVGGDMTAEVAEAQEVAQGEPRVGAAARGYSSGWPRLILAVVAVCALTVSPTPASAGPVEDTLQEVEHRLEYHGVYLTQESVAKRDLRNLAVSEEYYLTQYGRYASIPQMQNNKHQEDVTVSEGMTLSVLWYSPKNWCLKVSFTSMLDGSRTLFLDSAHGFYEEKGCPTKRPRGAKFGGTIKGAPPFLPTV